MKYVSIDIETTGLDPEIHQILEVGMVLDDLDRQDVPVDDLPSLRIVVQDPQDKYMTSAYAARMHGDLWDILANVQNPPPGTLIREPGSVANTMHSWLSNHGAYPAVPAGKNFGSFDLQFLKRLPNWNLKLGHRCLDPATLFLQPGDEKPPSLKECLTRSNIEKPVAHNAVEDAQDVCRVIRHGLQRSWRSEKT